MRPLVLLDVDGPLNPWAAKAESRPPGGLTAAHLASVETWLLSL